YRGYEARVGLFDGFPHDVRWDWVNLQPDDVLQVKYINYDYWTELSGGSRRAADAPGLIRAGVAPCGVSSEWAIGFEEAFAAGASGSAGRTESTSRDNVSRRAWPRGHRGWSRTPPAGGPYAPVARAARSRSASPPGP